jgi:hypothetical protein
MEYHQALFIKNLVANGNTLNEIAEKFFNKYGATDYCFGPFDPYLDRTYFSALEGNDLVFDASLIFHTRFEVAK